MPRGRPSSRRPARLVLPVVSIDGRPVGNGAPEADRQGLRRDYHRHAEISD